MGSGGWLKTLICLKGTKQEKYKQIENAVKKSNGPSRKNDRSRQQPTETVAAIRIQSAFRAYMARKALRRLRGVIRFRGVIGEDHSVKNQALSALKQIHFWSRIQAEIKDRWLGMVIEGRARQKKLENQLKLEAKLHDLEVEWCGGPETMEEIINRIQQREEAAAKRERTMAGGQIRVSILGKLTTTLAKKAGDGAGKNAGLLFVHGRIEFKQGLLPSSRNSKLGTKQVKLQT